MSRYQKGKAAARDKAARFQNTINEFNLSWGEMAEWQDHFHRLAKRFGLVREFQENGII